MTPEEKRRLKKKGKQIVAQHSAAVREVLRLVNPAPLSSAEWVANYRTQQANKKWLADHCREHILAKEIAKRFVLLSAQESNIPGAHVECLDCHDVLHTYPQNSLKCSCGTVVITYRRPPKITARGDRARLVLLIPKGNS